MYGQLKPKPKAIIERKENENPNLFIPPTDSLLQKLYGDKDDERYLRKRPLYFLSKNEYELSEKSPDWLKNIREYILKALNEGKLKDIMKGGNFKDVVLYGSYAYTFTVVKGYGEEELKKLKTVINNVQQMDDFYQKRLNVPDNFETDVYREELKAILHPNFEDYYHRAKTLIATRVPLCSNGSLKGYGQRLPKNTVIKVQRFAQLVYELTKVYRELMRRSIFHLDIKPDNLFICKGDKEEIYSIGDVDGLNFCKEENCKELFPPATIYYEPFRGLQFRGEVEFANRDVYALMKTFLVTYFDFFYPYAKMIGVLKFRKTDRFGNPISLSSDKDIKITRQMIQLCLDCVNSGRKNALKQYLNKRDESVWTALKKMMKKILTLMLAIDEEFGQKKPFAFAIDILDNELKDIQKLAKKVGAKHKDKIVKSVLGKWMGRETMDVETNLWNDDVEEMGVCWKGYRRNSKPRYSKGSCVKVNNGRRRRKFKEELKF
jgi:serine/threonine protein kinase